MSSRTRKCITLSVAVLMAWLVDPAGALVITQVDPDESLAIATWSITTETDHLEVDLLKEFYSPDMLYHPVILQFTLEAGDIGKTIWLVHDDSGSDVGESVLNDTGVTWNDYHILLANLPTGMPQYAGASFIDLSGVTSDLFGSPVSSDSDEINFAGGPVADGQTVHFSGIRIDYNDVIGGVFYLKQIPTPEPTCVALLALGGVGLFIRRRRN